MATQQEIDHIFDIAEKFEGYYEYRILASNLPNYLQTNQDYLIEEILNQFQFFHPHTINEQIKYDQLIEALNQLIAEKSFGTISGKILDEDGLSPLAGVLIQTAQNQVALTLSTETDDQGNYSLELPVGNDYSFMASKPLYTPQVFENISIIVDSVVTTDITMLLVRSNVIGKIVDSSNSEPLSGVTIKLFKNQEEVETSNVITNSTGDYIFENILVGGYYQIQASLEGYITKNNSDFVVTTENMQNQNLELDLVNPE